MNAVRTDKLEHPVRPKRGRWACWAGAWADWVFPDHCDLCRQPLPGAEAPICPDCWQRLRDDLQPLGCPTCGRTVGAFEVIDHRCHRCRTDRPAVARVVRTGVYQGALRQLVLALKFGRRQRLDAFLGDLLAQAIAGRGDLADIDCLMPIPLHWRRRWMRGFNQSELLARRAGQTLRRLGRRLPVRDNLVRLKYTTPQSVLPASQRQVNLAGAFGVMRGARLHGAHVCLVDDVTTTGATLRVAARALRRAGAARVSAAVLAVAAQDD